MNSQPLSALHKKINEGVKLAVQEAIDKHIKLDQAITIYQDGKIVTLKGQQIAEAKKQ